MVYLSNTEEAQVLFVPRAEGENHDDLVLTIRNTISLSERTFGVIDLHTSDLYYRLAVELPAGVDSGEYEYQLKSGEEVLSKGLLIVTESSNTTEYNKNIQYEQYKA